jgi:hypothetical protein
MVILRTLYTLKKKVTFIRFGDEWNEYVYSTVVFKRCEESDDTYRSYYYFLRSQDKVPCDFVGARKLISIFFWIFTSHHITSHHTSYHITTNKNNTCIAKLTRGTSKSWKREITVHKIRQSFTKNLGLKKKKNYRSNPKLRTLDQVTLILTHIMHITLLLNKIRQDKTRQEQDKTSR